MYTCVILHCRAPMRLPLLRLQILRLELPLETVEMSLGTPSAHTSCSLWSVCSYSSARCTNVFRPAYHWFSLPSAPACPLSPLRTRLQSPNSRQVEKQGGGKETKWRSFWSYPEQCRESCRGRVASADRFQWWKGPHPLVLFCTHTEERQNQSINHSVVFIFWCWC